MHKQGKPSNLGKEAIKTKGIWIDALVGQGEHPSSGLTLAKEPLQSAFQDGCLG